MKQLYKFLSSRYQNLFLEYKVNFSPRNGNGLPPHPQLYELINSQRSDYKRLLEQCLEFKTHFFEFKVLKDETNPELPAWNNGFLPGLDIIALYSLVALIRPNVYLEIGSGNSTKVVRQSIRKNNLQSKVISIDPQPRAEIDALADVVIRQTLETATYSITDALEENDILFIDNSHRILPNSDSTVFFLEILPRLKKGVVVHLHDIYLPYDYPQFMCDRFYSEQYGLAIYLLANPDRYKLLLPNYFVSEDTELSGVLDEVWENQSLRQVEKHGGSFWFVIQ